MVLHCQPCYCRPRGELGLNFSGFGSAPQQEEIAVQGADQVLLHHSLVPVCPPSEQQHPLGVTPQLPDSVNTDSAAPHGNAHAAGLPMGASFSDNSSGEQWQVRTSLSHDGPAYHAPTQANYLAELTAPPATAQAFGAVDYSWGPVELPIMAEQDPYGPQAFGLVAPAAGIPVDPTQRPHQTSGGSLDAPVYCVHPGTTDHQAFSPYSVNQMCGSPKAGVAHAQAPTNGFAPQPITGAGNSADSTASSSPTTSAVTIEPLSSFSVGGSESGVLDHIVSTSTPIAGFSFGRSIAPPPHEHPSAFGRQGRHSWIEENEDSEDPMKRCNPSGSSKIHGLPAKAARCTAARDRARKALQEMQEVSRKREEGKRRYVGAAGTSSG